MPEYEPGTGVGIDRVVPILPTAGAEASRDFYVGVLGLEVVMDHGWITTFAVPGRPSVQLSVLDRDAAAPVNPAVSIGVSGVDAVDALYAAVIEAGADVVYPLTDEPWGVRRFFVRDPAGTVLNVVGHPG